MREEFERLWPYGYSSRITPAHAGRIDINTGTDIVAGDHPRACGKNLPWPQKGAGVEGSPPRMREESKSVKPELNERRITPAHAGRIVLTMEILFIF